MVKVSGINIFPTPIASYDLSKALKWMCAEDPFHKSSHYKAGLLSAISRIEQSIKYTTLIKQSQRMLETELF